MKKELRNKKKKGFTLIELIVVIVILGILAAIAIPRFTGTLNNSKKEADNATERVVVSAVQLYRANTGSYPTTLAPLSPDYLDLGNLKWSDKSAIKSTSAVNSSTGAITFDPPKPTY